MSGTNYSYQYCEATGVLSLAVNTAHELRERERQLARARRWAIRYLEEHCDADGRRMEGGMSVYEFIHQVGVDRRVFLSQFVEERAARGMPADQRALRPHGRRVPRVQSFPEAVRRMGAAGAAEAAGEAL
jgi:hypothetical protein